MNRKSHLREEGFVLLELLVSVAILSAVMGSVYVLYFQGRQMLDALSVRDRKIRSTSVFLERIQTDLNGFAGLAKDSSPPDLGDGGKKDEEEEGAFIRMISILQRGDAPSTPRVVTYLLKKDPAQKAGSIVRREKDPSAEDDVATKEVLLLKGVSEVKLETYTSAWKEGWPANGRTSKLLRLTLLSEGRGKDIESAAFVFELPQNGSSTASALSPAGLETEGEGFGGDGPGGPSDQTEEDKSTSTSSSNDN